MENIPNRKSTIPASYLEIFDFLNENKQDIFENWTLLFEILRRLDELLESASSMSDLHKDTRIVLETIKLLHDRLLREIRNELTFEKLVEMTGSTVLEEFFLMAKNHSQAMTFVDHLSFNYSTKPLATPKRERTFYDPGNENIQKPETLGEANLLPEVNSALQAIKTCVDSKKSIEFFDLVFDPESYSKTVVNAFNLALAIRTKLVSLCADDGILRITSYDPENLELNHSVLEITYEEYMRVKENMDVKVYNNK